MQKDSKFFEDVAKLTSGAAGAFMDMKRELESMIADCLERFLAKERFVTREEFETAKAMAVKAREENEKLSAEIEKLKG